MIVNQQSVRFSEPLPLSSGKVLPEFSLAYETYGSLNPERDNAILVCHTLTKNSHLAGRYTQDDRKFGWWDKMVGPGKFLDTEKYFVICSDVLGGGRSTSPASIDPSTGERWGMNFPVVTVSDMVSAQKRLIDHLQLVRLAAVIGGCFGGQQALEWAIRYPAQVDRAVIISTSPATSAHSIAIFSIMRRLITGDPNWNNGDYYDKKFPAQGLANALAAAVPMWMSREAMEQRFGRRRKTTGSFGYTLDAEFLVEDYLAAVAATGKIDLDPNGLMYLMKSMEYFDLETQYGTLDHALASVHARVMLVSYESDWRYPPGEAERIHRTLRRLGKESKHVILKNALGHSAFVHDVSDIGTIMERFLHEMTPV